MHDLSYTTSGDAASPAAVFLHGFMGRSSDWRSFAVGFDDRFFSVAPDLPGHGNSLDLPENSYSMEGAARAVLRTLDDLGIFQASIVGYSMGGRLALYLALKHPERFASLVLESASPGLKTKEERRSRLASDEVLARRLETSDEVEFREFLEGWHRQPLFASLARHEGLVESLVSDRLRNDPKELGRSLLGMGTGSQPSLWEKLPNLRVPTLSIVGEFDEKFVRIAHEMSALSANVSVEVVAGAGHNVHLEAPEKFAALIRSFLRGESRPG